MTDSMHGAPAPLPTPELATGRRRFLRAGAGGLAALATLSFGQRADAARGDPMHILCSGPPGSIPDLVARAVADQLFITLGQRAVVDNRPGAAGQISVGALKAAAPDGAVHHVYRPHRADAGKRHLCVVSVAD